MNKQIKNPLDSLLDYFNGNQSHASKALGMTYQGFRVWMRQGFIPWRRDMDVERVTNGAVRASDVREWAANARLH